MTAQPGQKYVYLSFAGPEGFRGGCLIAAETQIWAVVLSHQKKINPGGEVLMFGPMPYEELDEAARGYPLDTLLSKSDLEKFGPMVRYPS